MAGRNAQTKRGGQASHGQGPGKRKLNIKFKKDDQVKVIAGKDKGKTGRVLSVDRIKGKVLVEGISMAKRHTKPNPSKQIKGGIAERESPIAVSNVMILTSGGVPSRIGYKIEGTGVSSRRVRFARKTGESLDKK
ncbi:MAG: 50S ribosomal protein L24 [Acidobacteriota bacterium]|nr:50S ribosomal protein L24 [Acidobacteriota bacterium]